MGPTHGWADGVFALGIAVLIAQLARMLLSRVLRRGGARSAALRSVGHLWPLEGERAAVAAPRGYREGAREQPVTLAAIAVVVGAIPGVRTRSDATRLQVFRAPNRTPLVLSVEAPERVTLGHVSIETTDEELALAVCHSLVPVLGEHCLELEGDMITIDHVHPLEQLQREHLHRVMRRLEKGQATLERMLAEAENQER